MKIERYLTQDDAAVLSRLAEQLLRMRDIDFNLAEKLADLISTSILLPENVRKNDCVSLYSRVRYRQVGSNDVQPIVIVCPHEVHETQAGASILAPLAMALIGRLEGSIVEVELPFNRVQFVEILSVEDPSSDLAEPAAPEAGEAIG